MLSGAESSQETAARPRSVAPRSAVAHAELRLQRADGHRAVVRPALSTRLRNWDPIVAFAVAVISKSTC